MATIDCEVRGHVGWLTLNSPEKLNALNEEMWAALPGRVATLAADDAVRVIVLRGAGMKAFSAGADISEFNEVRSGARAAGYNALNNGAFAALQDCPKPTISMISGFCLGGGFLLALSTDLRVAGHGAKFSLPPAKLGLGFDVRWISPLVKVMPPHRVKEMLFTGARYEAVEIAEFGLFNRLVADEDLLATTTELAETIAGNAPLTLHNVKTAIDALAENDQSVDFAAQDALTQRCFASEDYAEGRTAFAEKRKPVFKGR